MTSENLFKQYLTEAIYRIKALEDKSIKEIQHELGESIGKKGSLIEHWRKGNLPHSVEDLETIAAVIHQKTNRSREWMTDFLLAGNHLAPRSFLNNLYTPSFSEILSLPTEKLPKMAALPTGSIMTLAPNQLFVGRSQTVLDIANHFTDHEAPLSHQHQIVTLCGLGGIGKTQLASEFVHRYGQYFAGGVFWINFEEPESIAQQVAKCGGPGALNLAPNFFALSLESQLQMVRSSWQKTTPRLIIFDNCEEQELLEEWRPASGGCRILMTSRRSEWDTALNVKLIPMPVLYRHESVALLSRLLELEQPSNHPVLDQIAHEIGDLPLALHMAGRYLKRYQRTISPEMYLEWLKKEPSIQHDSMSLGGLSPTRHVQNIRRTFALSYDQLDSKLEEDQYAQTVLIRAAQFAPGEPIWVELLAKTINADEDEQSHLLKIDRGFSRLLELGLVEVDQQSMLRMHRLVAQFVRELNPKEVERTKTIIQSVVLAEASRVNAEGLPLPLLDWHVHLRSIVDLHEMSHDVHHIRLCNEIGEHFKQVEDFRGAIPYFKQAVMMSDALNEPLSLEKAKSYHNYGFVLREMTQMDRAYSYLSDALNARLIICKKVHPATAESYNELGRWYLRKGRLSEAEGHFRDALAIAEKILPEKHALKADFMNNLGMCLAIQKKANEGFGFIQSAFDMRKALFGVNHPRTVLSFNNMGYVLRDLEKYEVSKSYYEEALDINLTIFGEIHPKTAVSLINLGDVKIKLKAHEEAKVDLNRAQDIYVVMQDGKHLNVANINFNLGVIAEDESNLDEAMTFFGQALHIRQSKLGHAHPQTVRTKKRLQQVIKKRAS